MEAGVEEDDLEVGRDTQGEVEQHAVLERRRQHEPVAEGLGGPRHDLGGGRVLEPAGQRGQVGQVGREWLQRS